MLVLTSVVTFSSVPERRHLTRFELAAAMRELANPVALDPDLEPAEITRQKAPSLPHALLVFVGGFLGTLARYSVILHNAAPVAAFDPTILWINSTGAFALGVLGTTLFARRPEWTGLRVAVGTGLLGGWTTYSAVISGSLLLSHNRAPGAAFINLALELVIPVVCAGVGLMLGAVVNRVQR